MLAERMLQARERGGYRILPFVRMNAKSYITLAVYFCAVLAVLAWLELWPGVCVVLGLVFGVCLRDLSWLIGMQRTWPFGAGVTDWDKVQKIAAGLPLTEPGAAPNGGPATPSANSGATEGPPSVS